MRIPSYDDLTPSIPDISAGDVLTSAARLLPDGGPVAARAVRAGPPSRALFGALHGGMGDRLMAIARDFSPRVERHPGNTVVLDVAGLQRLLGDAAAIAADLTRAGAPRVAIATSQMAAMLLARARSGITIDVGEPEAALRDVPIAVLQQLLADAASAPDGRAFDVLRRWGLTTLGEFAALPAADLSARLGPDGVAIQRLARGLDPRPLMPDPGVPRFLASCELEWPIDTLEPLSFVFARLLDPLAAALERADRGAVAIHLALRLTDRTSHARTLQLPAAMRDARVLRTLLLLDLESHPPPAAVDVVSIELDPAPARIVQYSLLERAVPSPETLATLMARLGALVGDARCGAPVLLDTHRPDAFAMGPLRFAETRDVNSQLSTPNSQKESLDAMGPHSTQQARTGTFRPTGSTHVPWELPAAACRTVESDKLWRGLAEARSESGAREGGEVGSWELGVDSAACLRRFRPPVAVRVAVDGGRPVRVAIDRQRMPGGTIRHAAGPWRTSGGWWDTERWNRDEWDAALSDGSICRLFRDRDSGHWFLEAVYD